jgi:hypothetical protein
VSIQKICRFDLLSEHAAPYAGFGDPLAESPDRVRKFLGLVEDARGRLESGFKRRLDDPHSLSQQIDVIVDEMWSQGWSPDEGNINLFVTDFGLVLTGALLALYGGNLVFRSEEDISHLSIWWPARKIEAFPFHRLLKCLFSREVNSVSLFVDRISGMLVSQGSEPPSI